MPSHAPLRVSGRLGRHAFPCPSRGLGKARLGPRPTMPRHALSKARLGSVGRGGKARLGSVAAQLLSRMPLARPAALQLVARPLPQLPRVPLLVPLPLPVPLTLRQLLMMNLPPQRIRSAVPELVPTSSFWPFCDVCGGPKCLLWPDLACCRWDGSSCMWPFPTSARPSHHQNLGTLSAAWVLYTQGQECVVLVEAVLVQGRWAHKRPLSLQGADHI